MERHAQLTPPNGKRRRWRGRRWILGTAGGLVGLIVLAIAAVLIALHTSWGRELIRRQVEAQLQNTFTGGGSLGRLEGSPFGELTLHELVIRGPDKQPAISVKTLTVELGILPLLSHQARVAAVLAEDVDVDLKRDVNGELEIKHLMRPSPKSAWSVGLPKIQLRRAHIAVDTGSETMNIDGLMLDGRVELPHNGPIDAAVELHGSWRERASAPLSVQVALRSDAAGLVVSSLTARAGEVSVTGSHVTVVTTGDGPPVIGGTVSINAGAAAVARLIPTVVLPSDVALTVSATPVANQPWTTLVVTGRVGQTEVKLTGAADLAGKHAKGELSTGALDLTALSSGKIEGTASAQVAFDVRPGGPEALPIGRVTIRGWGTVGDMPTTTFDIALTSAGERVRAVVDASGNGVHGTLTANLRIARDLLAIEEATLHAETSDPARASRGTVPLHGTLQIDLAASGTLRPTPSLAVSGTIDGRQLRVKDLSARSLHVALDAKRLPNRPYGSAHVQVADLVRGDMQLRVLTVDAADRSDGKIAVAVRSQPEPSPWLIDADALVTPPGVTAAAGQAGGVVIDLLRHRVRPGAGADWTGHGGRVEIDPERIVVRALESVSAASRIAIAGSFERVGRRAGDLAANIDVTSLSLDTVAKGYQGKVDTHVVVSRRGGAWDGEVTLDGTGLSMDPKPVPASGATGWFAVLPAMLRPPPVTAAVAKAVASSGKSAAAGPAAKPPAAGAVAMPLPSTVNSSSAPGGGAANGAPPATSPSPVSVTVSTGVKPQAPPGVTSSPPPAEALAAPLGTPVPVPIGPVVVDAHAKATLHGSQLAVTVDAASRGLGTAKLALELVAPRVITDPQAWKRLDRKAIRTGDLSLRGVAVGRVAQIAGAVGPYTGKIEGDLKLSADAISGRISATHIVVPRLRGTAGINVVLELSQSGPSELTPSVSATIPGVGAIQVQARVIVPDRAFDPASWAALGPRMLHGATVRADNVTVDPAILDRFGIISDLRGKVSLSVEIGEAAATMKAAVDVVGLRGNPFLQPIDIRLAAETGDRETTTTLAIKSSHAPLLDLQGRLPGSMMDLLLRFRADPQAAQSTKLAATAKLASVDAAKLLAVFGRTEIISGTIDGDVELAGTFGTPTAKLKLTATALKVPPGPRGKPIKTVDRIAVVGSWDGHTVKLDIDGAESEGGTLKISAAVAPDALRDASVTLKATKLDLIPILVFVPGPAGGAAGQLDANVTLKGLDLRTMKLAGEVHLTGARLPISPQIGTLRQAKIDAVISDHEIKLNVDGLLGGGSVIVDGSVALDGMSPNGGKAKLTLRKVSPIGVVEPTISADVTATLAHEGNQWHADLVVDNGFIVVPNDRAEKLKPVGMPDDMRFATGTRGTRRVRAQQAPVNPIFVVTVTLHSTRVESEEFRGLLKGKIEARADGDAFGVFGGIDADRGDLDLFGRRYYVERAGVHFDGPLDPLLDVRITHDFSDVTTVTEVRGRVSRPELQLTSDPGTYSQSELLGFLLGGDPSGEAGGVGSDRVANAGASIIANKLGGYVRGALPIDIDVLRYEAATAATSAAVTVGTWITHSLFVAYRQHLESRTDENTGEGEVEYWLSRRVMIEGTAGDRGVNGIDLLWRRRY